MYICVCNAVNEEKLKDIITHNKIVSMSELQKHRVCDRCTRCFNSSLEVLNMCVDERFKNEDWYISPKDNCHWELKC